LFLEEEDTDDERYEGDDLEDQEDTEIVNFVDQGYYGYVAPQEQFDVDDDIDKLNYKNWWIWDIFMSRWRHRLIAAWRLMKHRLFELI
jgi:hypothetical protein